MPVTDPCKIFACKIQACLKEKNFQEEACKDVIEEMRKCCRIWRDKSFVCQGMGNSEKPEETKN